MEQDEIQKLQIEIVIAGHTNDPDLPSRFLGHVEPRLRIAALSALERLGQLDNDRLRRMMGDPDPNLRRRLAEIAAAHPGVDLTPLLDDVESLVVEMAAWACGEQMQPDDDGNRSPRDCDDDVLERLIKLATRHSDALVRESAIAALGAIGDDRAVPAIIAGCSDKPQVRRRAVLALAPFSGDEVDATLRRALEDRDWQVRQAAEDVLGSESSSAPRSFDDQQDSEENEED